MTCSGMRDFAAIDFETANNERASVCSVGVVIVRGGEIVDKFYSLIKPEPEYYKYWCGLTCVVDYGDGLARCSPRKCAEHRKGQAEGLLQIVIFHTHICTVAQCYTQHTPLFLIQIYLFAFKKKQCGAA